MVKNFNSNTTNTCEWLTPIEIIRSLGPFDLDPCSPINRPWDTADSHYTIQDDGLSKDWMGRVWLNPPYGKQTFKWIKKLKDHGNGIALIFARTDTIGFQENVFTCADGIFFIKKRIKFVKMSFCGKLETRQGANAPSCLVIFGQENLEKIKESGLTGHLCLLR
jgi:hypothetical protein